LTFLWYWSFAGAGGGGVGGEVGADSRVVDESMVEVLISEVVREIDGVVAAVTLVATGEVIDKEGVTGREGEVVALAKAADNAFCSAVMPNGRLGIAGGLSKERFRAGDGVGGRGEGAGGRGELSLVEVVERAGDLDADRSTCCVGGRGRTFEKRDRPRPGVSGIDAISSSVMRVAMGKTLGNFKRRINGGITSSSYR
jgi:hypothetical protein